jgi:hypothetical protein
MLVPTLVSCCALNRLKFSLPVFTARQASSTSLSKIQIGSSMHMSNPCRLQRPDAFGPNSFRRRTCGEKHWWTMFESKQSSRRRKRNEGADRKFAKAHQTLRGQENVCKQTKRRFTVMLVSWKPSARISLKELRIRKSTAATNCADMQTARNRTVGGCWHSLEKTCRKLGMECA